MSDGKTPAEVLCRLVVEKTNAQMALVVVVLARDEGPISISVASGGRALPESCAKHKKALDEMMTAIADDAERHVASADLGDSSPRR